MKKVRGYVFSRSFMGERVPQHVQNLVIRDYCERNGLLYLLSAAEYAMEDCHMILEQLLAELPDLDGIAAYSLFQLPEDRSKRQRLYAQLLDMRKTLHFAVEGLHLSTSHECDRIETLWRVRQTLPICPQNASVNWGN
jgi:sporadic carbohydrate cluster protein (TIGR04323 family)